MCKLKNCANVVRTNAVETNFNLIQLFIFETNARNIYFGWLYIILPASVKVKGCNSGLGMAW